jgi:hypothetical protein
MEKLISKITALFTVKSLVTLILTTVFAYLALAGSDVSETFKTVYVMIVGFYFGVQTTKDKE